MLEYKGGSRIPNQRSEVMTSILFVAVTVLAALSISGSLIHIFKNVGQRPYGRSGQ